MRKVVGKECRVCKHYMHISGGIGYTRGMCKLRRIDIGENECYDGMFCENFEEEEHSVLVGLLLLLDLLWEKTKEREGGEG